MDVGDVDHIHAVDTAAVPREEAISRPARQPTVAPEAAAETKTKVDTPSSPAKSEEGHICRGPDWIVTGVDRSRPPPPVAAINEPASIMVGSPAPGLIRNPGPSIIGLVHPAAVAIR